MFSMFNNPNTSVSKSQIKERLDKVNSTMAIWLSDTSKRFSEISQKTAGGMIRSNPFWHISKQVELGERVDDQIILITQFFTASKPNRMNELQTSLKINCNNPFIDKVVLLNEKIYSTAELGIESPKIQQIVIGKRLDYKSVFDVVEREKIHGFIVLSNLDIFFDKSIDTIRRTGISNKKGMFCLLRHEYKPGRSVSQSPIFEYQSNSQDTWIWHSNFNVGTKEREICDFQLGVPGCDNTIAYLAHVFGYEVYNLPKLIKSYHNHSTNVRSYNDSTPKTLQPYYYVLAPLNDNQRPDPNHSFTFIDENNVFRNYLKKAIDSGEPFVVPRLAGIEHMYAMMGAYAAQRGKFDTSEADFLNKTRSVMKNNAGIFLPDANSVIKYSQAYLDAFHRCELYMDWEPQGDVASAYGGGLQMAYEFIQVNFDKQRIWSFGVADIFHLIYQEEPWTLALRGKRLLIVSPFAETFKKQLPVLQEIYGRDLFPDCSFVFIKPPITNGTNQSKPFDEELDNFMKWVEVIKDKFDIALVSCGGYGNPVVGRIHALGKSAIYVGGVLQMYFGVYGSRWERERPLIMRLFKNKHWVRPTSDERPQGFEKVEQSCYW